MSAESINSKPWIKRHAVVLIWVGITSPYWFVLLTIVSLLTFGDLPEVEDLLNPQTNQ